MGYTDSYNGFHVYDRVILTIDSMEFVTGDEFEIECIENNGFAHLKFVHGVNGSRPELVGRKVCVPLNDDLVKR